MATNIKYFLGTLNVTIGEYQNSVRILLVANSEAQADELLFQAAASYYGNGDEELEDGGYYANHGEVHTKPASLVEVGAATFFELRPVLTTRIAGNVVLADLDAAMEPGFKAFAKAVVNGLRARRIEVKQTNMLEVLASAFGQKNWQVLQAKFQAPSTVTSSTVAPTDSTFEGRDENRHALHALFDVLEKSPATVLFRERTWTVESCSREALTTEKDWFETALRLNLAVDDTHELAGASYGFAGVMFTGAIVEDFTTVVLADGTRIVFTLPEQEWSANVCRTGWGFADIPVKARTSAEAEMLALDIAGDHSYSEKNSEYEVDWVVPTK